LDQFPTWIDETCTMRVTSERRAGERRRRMATTSVVGQVRNGMEVVTSDGESLGKVKETYIGTEPTSPLQQCDDETTVEVHRGGLFSKSTTMYVPCRALARVDGNTVTLNVDQETANAKGWQHKPSWIGT